MKRYVEVFGGAGWVLFNKDKHAEQEVYNDINSQLVNLFRCIKYHHNAIIDEMEYMLNSREMFNGFKNLDIESLTDIQKAARYLYLIKASYGNKVDTYGSKPRDVLKFDNIDEIKRRLKTVVIENKSFTDIFKQYDKADTLFYCDPPYYKTEKYYDTGNFVFDESQHILLRDILTKIDGKFILSYNDCDFIRNIYKDFAIDEIERNNNLSSVSGTGKVYKELIIKNY